MIHINIINNIFLFAKVERMVDNLAVTRIERRVDNLAAAKVAHSVTIVHLFTISLKC